MARRAPRPETRIPASPPDEPSARPRQVAITTDRSEIEFEQRFTGRVEPDGTPSVVSYLRHQGRKLLERFDPDTYRTLVLAMDAHDVGRGRGGLVAALQKLAA